MAVLAGSATALGFIVMVASAVLGAFEWLGTLSFSAWAFRVGPKVLNVRLNLPEGAFSSEARYDSLLGQLRGVAEGVLVFTARGARTAGQDTYAVRGTVRLESGEAIVEGRLSLATVGFFSGLYLFLLGLSVSSLGAGDLLFGLGALAAALIGIGATLLWAIPLEVQRARRFLGEYQESFDGGVPNQRFEPTP